MPDVFEEIQKELLALRKSRVTAAQPATNAQPKTTPETKAFLSSSSASDTAGSTVVAGNATVVAPQRSTPPPAEVKSNPNDPHSEPFAWGDFTWLKGNARTKDTPYATEFFTPEIRVDANYTYDFRHPKDDTISGSSEVFRANEVQLTQLGVGGDFHYKNVRARLMTQFGMYSQTTPRNDASPAAASGTSTTPTAISRRPTAAITSMCMHGINVEAGIFMSYVGLFSYYNFDNWAYQPSYVSSNTPWFFNGVRVQIFPTDKLKIEPWFINGWQSYGRFNSSARLRRADSLAPERQAGRSSATSTRLGNDTLGVSRNARATTPTTASRSSTTTSPTRASQQGGVLAHGRRRLRDTAAA